ncbi:hypothetical protein L1049_012537 [Liquidambar formosana]|uniref:Uncharacterized protein n=1 Tax=Liquidambar formosana TaxID=63359 RepID=A0AAP0R2I9_LIQFO
MRVQTRCIVDLCTLWKTKSMKDLKGEEEQVKERCIGMKCFTMGMQGVLLLLQVHLGHIVVEAFYLKPALLSLLPVYSLSNANLLFASASGDVLKAFGCGTWTKPWLRSIRSHSFSLRIVCGF